MSEDKKEDVKEKSLEEINKLKMESESQSKEMMKDDKPIEKSEDVKQMKKPKQFLLMADEMVMAMLGRLVPGVKFLEVEGMVVEGNNNHQFLVNPNQPKKEQSDAENVQDTSQTKE